MAVLIAQPVMARQFGGSGSISGAVADASGNPAVREVLVYDAFSGRLIRRAASGVDGAYTVGDLRPGLAVRVIAVHPTTGHNDLVAARVVVA